QNAGNVEGAIQAIEEVISDIVSNGYDGTKRIDYTIGSNFLTSARKWGFDKNKSDANILIESCARIILDCPKNEVNVFRESENTDKQRKRADGALAFRTHLTKRGVGFRLMFWRHTDGKIEFANVGSKNELEIM
ncbi:MAG TPA: hypothetical protein PLK94_01140, partial [Alphaproteobacteria bacterium]|nr:hypothetical protein [Alphaproteobacteria bacterium]